MYHYRTKISTVFIYVIAYSWKGAKSSQARLWIFAQMWEFLKMPMELILPAVPGVSKVDTTRFMNLFSFELSDEYFIEIYDNLLIAHDTFAAAVILFINIQLQSKVRELNHTVIFVSRRNKASAVGKAIHTYICANTHTFSICLLC